MANTVSTVIFRKLTKSVAFAITPESIMSSSDAARFVTAFKVYVPSGNTGANVYIGDSTVDATWDPIASGDKEAYNAGEGSWGKDMVFDLSKFFVAVETDGDSVVIIYKTTVKSDA